MYASVSGTLRFEWFRFALAKAEGFECLFRLGKKFVGMQVGYWLHVKQFLFGKIVSEGFAKPLRSSNLPAHLSEAHSHSPTFVVYVM